MRRSQAPDSATSSNHRQAGAPSAPGKQGELPPWSVSSPPSMFHRQTRMLAAAEQAPIQPGPLSPGAPHDPPPGCLRGRAAETSRSSCTCPKALLRLRVEDGMVMADLTRGGAGVRSDALSSHLFSLAVRRLDPAWNQEPWPEGGRNP